jgi:transposase-like protein
VDYMERQRWGDSPRCPHAGCGGENVYRMMGRDGKREQHRRWRCRSCGRMFSVKVGTVMEDSRLPVRAWVFAFWHAASNKNGVAALELRRNLGINYRSALYMLNRIREAMSDWNEPASPLTGTVECDETYYGGKPRRIRPYQAREPGQKKLTGRGAGKQPIFGMVERDGRLRLSPVPDVTAHTLATAIRENVDAGSRIMTDDWSGYRALTRYFPERGHHAVSHSMGEYVRDGDIHSNTIESAFSLLKRGVSGTYHAVSRKHLHRYCDEFAFRWSWRKATDLGRAGAAIRKSQGKRLTRRAVEGPSTVAGPS